MPDDPNEIDPEQLSEESFDALDDEFFEALMETHQGLSDEESASLNARLLLLLANEIGDIELLREAMQLARESVLTDRPQQSS
jgi:hypothetical protein